MKKTPASPGASILTEPTQYASAHEEHNLRQAVERSMENYFRELGHDDFITNLYEVVMSEVEAPLLKAVLRHHGDNQSRASTMLGLSRGTLRKKMKQYGLL